MAALALTESRWKGCKTILCGCGFFEYQQREREREFFVIVISFVAVVVVFRCFCGFLLIKEASLLYLSVCLYVYVRVQIWAVLMQLNKVHFSIKCGQKSVLYTFLCIYNIRL